MWYNSYSKYYIMTIELNIEDIPVGIVEECRKIGISDSKLVNEYADMLVLAIGERRSTDWSNEEIISHMADTIL